MTLSECYAALGGDYGPVLDRLRSEAMVKKFLLRFPEDGSYDLLAQALAAGDQAEAFRGAHTLKGVCQNLGLDRLYGSSAELCEALRGELREEAPELFEQVKADYVQTVSAIRTYRDSGAV